MLVNATFKGVYNLKANVYAGNRKDYTTIRNGVDPGLMYLSCFGTDQEVSIAVNEIKESDSITVGIHTNYFRLSCHHAEYITSKLPNSDFHHLIIYRKDEILNQNTADEALCLFAYTKAHDDFELKKALENDLDIPDDIIQAFFDKLYTYAPVYVKRDWIRYILKNNRHYLFSSISSSKSHGIAPDEDVNHPSKENDMDVYCLEIPTAILINTISKGLREKDIFIRDNFDKTSEVMEGITGLDAYLNNFVDDLALKIRGSFDPYFNPESDSYTEKVNLHDDYVTYMDHLKLFSAQKAVVQACCNAFDEGKRCLYLICEMGTGKTNMSSSIVMADYKKMYGMTNVVMCPGTLCNKWARTLEAEIPFAEVHIINNVNDVIRLSDKIKDRNRKTNLWMVISKDRMKTNYALRPAARWKRKAKCYMSETGSFTERHDTYVCPECGQPLFGTKIIGSGRRRRKQRIFFDETSFSSRNAHNSFCMNQVRKFDNATHTWKTVPCNASLWRACNKVNEDDFQGNSVDWVKVGGEMGWVERQHMQSLADKYLDENVTMPVVVRKKGNALLDTINGNGIAQTAPKSYCISKYMRNHFKNFIDYAIIDEVHELSGESTLQGEAMGDIVRTARKSLCLTGTLLNGYAKSIFYMLFRTHPALMIQEGFSYDKAGETAFTKAFGVYKHSRYEAMVGYQNKKGKASTIKALPGASPLIYTKFLMNNAVFACIDDMAEGLPGYSEIPISVNMDTEMAETYETMGQEMRTAMNRQRNSKTMSQIALMMTAWPDQPYDQPPIIDPDSKDIIYTPPDMSSEELTVKDEECLRIIRANVAQGRKVMVYYTYPGRTDVDRRLPQILNEEGINTSVLLSKKPDNFRGRLPKWMGIPSADHREEWINEQLDNGCQVLFVNPKLIQTGLDLIAFPTIIFYQTGYNLSDMRQASRRSWRLGQTQNVEVYFLYYAHSVQETILSMMATKLQAALAIEGKFSEEGLQAMSNNEDILSQVAASVAEGVQETLDINVFSSTERPVQNSELASLKQKNYLIDTPREYKYAVKPKIKIRSRKRAYDCANEVNALKNPSALFAAI